MTQALAQARKALEDAQECLAGTNEWFAACVAGERLQNKPEAMHSRVFYSLNLVDSALAAIDAAQGGAVPKDGESHRTVFAWAWTLFGNGSIWRRALTWTKDDPFAVEVANPNFTSVAVPLYTDEELSAALAAIDAALEGGAVPKVKALEAGPLVGKYGDVLLPFVNLMEHELHANSGKGDRPGWLAMDRKTALLEIFYHLAKLQKATKDDDQAGIREYGADVANMAMMLVDICGALDLPSPPTGA